MKLTKHPPMVPTGKKPREIVDSIMSPYEQDAMVKLLVAYQRKRPEWDVFRKKIPPDLLEKWGEILKECRLNGYMAPRVIRENEIIWYRVMGFERQRAAYDQCVLCTKGFDIGECEGRVVMNSKMERVFRPCWHNGSSDRVRAEIHNDDVPF